MIMTIDEVLENRFNEIKETLAEKQKQYAHNRDQFHNFDKISRFTGQSPESVLWGFVTKHIAALDDFVEDTGTHDQPLEQWNEKIGDIITYMLLLEALIWRRKEEEAAERQRAEQ